MGDEKKLNMCLPASTPRADWEVMSSPAVPEEREPNACFDNNTSSYGLASARMEWTLPFLGLTLLGAEARHDDSRFTLAKKSDVKLIKEGKLPKDMIIMVGDRTSPQMRSEERRLSDLFDAKKYDLRVLNNESGNLAATDHVYDLIERKGLDDLGIEMPSDGRARAYLCHKGEKSCDRIKVDADGKIHELGDLSQLDEKGLDLLRVVHARKTFQGIMHRDIVILDADREESLETQIELRKRFGDVGDTEIRLFDRGGDPEFVAYAREHLELFESTEREVCWKKPAGKERFMKEECDKLGPSFQPVSTGRSISADAVKWLGNDSLRRSVVLIVGSWAHTEGARKLIQTKYGNSAHLRMIDVDSINLAVVPKGPLEDIGITWPPGDAVKEGRDFDIYARQGDVTEFSAMKMERDGTLIKEDAPKPETDSVVREAAEPVAEEKAKPEAQPVLIDLTTEEQVDAIFARRQRRDLELPDPQSRIVILNRSDASEEVRFQEFVKEQRGTTPDVRIFALATNTTEGMRLWPRLRDRIKQKGGAELVPALLPKEPIAISYNGVHVEKLDSRFIDSKPLLPPDQWKNSPIPKIAGIEDYLQKVGDLTITAPFSAVVMLDPQDPACHREIRRRQKMQHGPSLYVDFSQGGESRNVVRQKWGALFSSGLRCAQYDFDRAVIRQNGVVIPEVSGGMKTVWNIPLTIVDQAASRDPSKAVPYYVVTSEDERTALKAKLVAEHGKKRGEIGVVTISGPDTLEKRREVLDFVYERKMIEGTDVIIYLRSEVKDRPPFREVWEKGIWRYDADYPGLTGCAVVDDPQAWDDFNARGRNEGTVDLVIAGTFDQAIDPLSFGATMSYVQRLATANSNGDVLYRDNPKHKPLTIDRLICVPIDIAARYALAVDPAFAGLREEDQVNTYVENQAEIPFTLLIKRSSASGERILTLVKDDELLAKERGQMKKEVALDPGSRDPNPVAGLGSLQPVDSSSIAEYRHRVTEAKRAKEEAREPAKEDAPVEPQQPRRQVVMEPEVEEQLETGGRSEAERSEIHATRVQALAPTLQNISGMMDGVKGYAKQQKNMDGVLYVKMRVTKIRGRWATFGVEYDKTHQTTGYKGFSSSGHPDHILGILQRRLKRVRLPKEATVPEKDFYAVLEVASYEVGQLFAGAKIGFYPIPHKPTTSKK